MEQLEHRLFSQISRNWRSRPRESLEMIVNLIGATTTITGLTVTADAGDYPTGIMISNKQMKDLPIAVTAGTASGTTPCTRRHTPEPH
jgi:hypothetical protein